MIDKHYKALAQSLDGRAGGPCCPCFHERGGLQRVTLAALASADKSDENDGSKDDEQDDASVVSVSSV